MDSYGIYDKKYAADKPTGPAPTIKIFFFIFLFVMEIII